MPITDNRSRMASGSPSLLSTVIRRISSNFGMRLCREEVDSCDLVARDVHRSDQSDNHCMRYEEVGCTDDYPSRYRVSVTYKFPSKGVFCLSVPGVYFTPRRRRSLLALLLTSVHIWTQQGGQRSMEQHVIFGLTSRTTRTYILLANSCPRFYHHGKPNRPRQANPESATDEKFPNELDVKKSGLLGAMLM